MYNCKVTSGRGGGLVTIGRAMWVTTGGAGGDGCISHGAWKVGAAGGTSWAANEYVLGAEDTTQCAVGR
jgi:hypothetical protein